MPGVTPKLSISAKSGAARCCAVLLMLWPITAPTQAQNGPLFPEPFRVEHHLEESSADSEHHVSASVTDTYGGSFLVSERVDGSRLILDFGRHEILGVDPAKGTYWVVSIDRLADLQHRLAAIEGDPQAEADASERGRLGAARAKPQALVVEEVRGLGAAGSGQAGLAGRTDILHFRAVDPSKGRLERAPLEASFDPSVRLTSPAAAALDDLAARLAGAKPDEPSAAALESMRRQAGNALAVRTSRAALLPPGGDGNDDARVDDITTRVERLEIFPAELLVIPDGFRRVAHPLEAAIRYLEQDEEWRRQIGGGEETP